MDKLSEVIKEIQKETIMNLAQAIKNAGLVDETDFDYFLREYLEEEQNENDIVIDTALDTLTDEELKQ